MAEIAVLKEEVLQRRGDVHSLLDRVDLHSGVESRRVKEADRFLAELSATRLALETEIQAVVVESRDRSSTVVRGIEDMMGSGRETCSRLTAAVDAALHTLLVDSEAAKTSMTEACGELADRLAATSSSLEVALRRLQQDLSSWLDSVDVTLGQVKIQCAEQQVQLEGFGRNLVAQTTAVQEMSRANAKEQRRAVDRSLAAGRLLQEELQERIRVYEQEERERHIAATQVARAKAQAMQKVGPLSSARLDHMLAPLGPAHPVP